MVVTTSYQHPSQGGNHLASTQGVGPSNIDPTIYMMEVDVSIQTRAKNYEMSGNEPKGKEQMATLANPLLIERPA